MGCTQKYGSTSHRAQPMRLRAGYASRHMIRPRPYQSAGPEHHLTARRLHSSSSKTALHFPAFAPPLKGKQGGVEPATHQGRGSLQRSSTFCLALLLLAAQEPNLGHPVFLVAEASTRAGEPEEQGNATCRRALAVPFTSRHFACCCCCCYCCCRSGSGHKWCTLVGVGFDFRDPPACQAWNLAASPTDRRRGHRLTRYHSSSMQLRSHIPLLPPLWKPPLNRSQAGLPQAEGNNILLQLRRRFARKAKRSWLQRYWVLLLLYKHIDV